MLIADDLEMNGSADGGQATINAQANNRVFRSDTAGFKGTAFNVWSSELGIPNVEAAALVGLVAPAATPPQVIASLQKSVAAAIRNPAVNKKLMDFGVEPVGSSSAEFAALIASESTRWHKLIRDLKITLD